MTVDPMQFAEFFSKVHSDTRDRRFAPFPWQHRLAQQVCSQGQDGKWPDALALPTGSGKTACIDIAVFALACQAHIPTNERTAPRRIIFVVDRRVIVDEAFEHALSLARRLDDANGGILKQVADALRNIAGSDTPLTCHQLRGGMYRDDAWARTPSQPCIIASTVDQIGSRLLFRSYGRSFKSWPVHAGLAGNDALILLDEAHCANPFRQTMVAVQSYRRKPWSEAEPANPFHFVILSATPPSGCGSIIRADGDDRSHLVLGPRLGVAKPTLLTVATKAKGTNVYRELAIALVEVAFATLDRYARANHQPPPPAVAILVNRVLTARLVHNLLGAVAHHLDPHWGTPSDEFGQRIVKRVARKYAEFAGSFGQSFDRELMTGRMRPIDRHGVTAVWLERLSAEDSPDRQLDRPVFITATQCLEVGANLDFDVMVSECASLDALRQRLGRLNRTGRSIVAPAAIVIRKDQETPKDPDPIYDEALATTWKQLRMWLSEENHSTHAGDNGSDLAGEKHLGGTAETPCTGSALRLIDFGVTAMESRWDSLDNAHRARLVPPAPDAPVMLPAHIDAWCQTSPIPNPSPDISLFLHGPRRGAPEVQVCWRSDLESSSARDSEERGRRKRPSEQEIIEAVSLCPPTTMECLSVPRHLFLRWWYATAKDDKQRTRDQKEAAEELGDVDGSGETPIEALNGWNALALIWRGPKDSCLLRSAKQLQPGDTVVLPASAGGWDAFGYVPDAYQHTIDVGDRCHWLARGRAILRLRLSELVPPRWPDTGVESCSRLREALKDYDREAEPDTLPDRDDILEWLHDLASGIGNEQPEMSWLHDAINRGLPKASRPELLPHPFGGVVLRGRVRVRRDTLTANDLFTTEDDTASTGGQVTLQCHCEAVGQRAEAFARRCDLPPIIIQTMNLAGRLHDLGKSDRRFQAYLFGGNLRMADLAHDLFAKSAGLRDNRSGYASAWKYAGLPDGFRHEILSLQLIQEFAEQLTIGPAVVQGDGGGKDGDSQASAIDLDLLAHLVGMHHGHCRPFAPVVIDKVGSNQMPRLDIDLRPAGIDIVISGVERRNWPPMHQIDSGIAERFWRLVRRYGWWGLAWLESIFVLADHRTSEEQSQQAIRPSGSAKRTTGVLS